MTHFVGQAGGTPVPTGAPESFAEHAYQKTFFVGHPVWRVWAWLNDPATFVDGQVWPFRVEFVSGGFEPGVLNVHHGPFLNAAGAIGEVRGPGERPAYRDLKYFYGSYVLSPRLARPTRLQFWAEEGRGGTMVTLRLDALVRRPFVRVWDLGQRVFWSRFPRCQPSASLWAAPLPRGNRRYLNLFEALRLPRGATNRCLLADSYYLRRSSEGEGE